MPDAKRRSRLATIVGLASFALAVVVAIVLAFDLLGFARPETGDLVTVEGTVARDPIAGLVLDTGDERLWLPGVEERSEVPVEPGDEVRVEGEFFEVSIHQLSGIEVEEIEPR